MVLQRGLQVVGDGQVMAGLDQEVIVDPRMLKVVYQGCYIGRQQAQAVCPLALQHPPMHHQHVGHLKDRCHMRAAEQVTCLSAWPAVESCHQHAVLPECSCQMLLCTVTTVICHTSSQRSSNWGPWTGD